jgi:hypothetical protein
MKIAQIGCVIGLVLSVFTGYSQDGASSYTFAQKFFQHEIQFGVLNEVGRTPMFQTTYFEDDPDRENQEVDTYSDYISFFRLAYEPKLIVKQFEDRASISVSVPVSVGLNIADRINDELFLTSRVGFFVDGNIGDLSTYNNIKRRGASFGVGVNGVIPLVDGGDVNNTMMLIAPHFRLGYVKTFNFRRASRISFYLFMSPGRMHDFEQLDGRVEQHRVGNSIGFMLRKRIGNKI